MSVYKRANIALEKGLGCYVWDKDGRCYLDFSSGVAVTCLGHAHPHLVRGLTEQAQKLWHTSNLFSIPQQEKLAHRLTEHTFAEKVFFTNSGVEAWECALKLMRKYQSFKGYWQRYRMITVEKCFHGRTFAAISSSQEQKMTEGLGTLLDGFDQVPINDVDAVRRAITAQTAGICIEPIQGEGGVRVCEDEYVRALRQLADDHGILLIFDEIQCGMGRTGRLCAYEWLGVEPDVMCLAKGIGGGFPLGACLATEDAASGMTYGSHGSTFGGNPLAMAVGNAVLDVLLEPGFLENVQRISELLRQRLTEIVEKPPNIFKEVRGRGLLLGLECIPPLEDIREYFFKCGLLTVVAQENVIRLLPPLIIGEAEVEQGCRLIEKAVDMYVRGETDGYTSFC